MFSDTGPLAILIPGATIRQEQLEIKQRKKPATDKVNATCSAASLFNYVDNTER